MYKRTLLIDLDGVLNTYNGNYNPDFIPPMREGAKEFLLELQEKFELVLFTTRPKSLAQQWCFENGLLECFEDITDKKKSAWLIIDDRCLTFNGNFEDLTLQILNFAPFYKATPPVA